ncbi:protein kinase [Actinoplanes sp. TBRC 11911]|uniref:serine/threonine-protein kinase n=1 Tax=Actinoplanes sp. TBRC 11911 TaxID=2729386 RepID=UPI00145DA2E4|nr:serine/threonine-protein kinase [Actinoplanes sp. TBRC 11911]NMO49945.1 protein kinase [Actinoplanes sp. TBRC 11911]
MSDQPLSDRPLAGRYRFVGQLGKGAMGRVWEAHDELLGRAVAIKEIAPNGLSTTELGDLRRRAIREARAIAKVSHRNVVRIFDVVEQGGAPWIVMELVRSRSLLDAVTDDGPVEPRRAARIGLEVLAALRSAHDAGILHRDVKPANVLLAEDGRVVLTDFGLAAVAGDSGMTSTGVVIGSPSYLAPELALDQPARPGSDLWSLGATLFAAVEGRPPYVKSSPMATLASLMIDPAPVPKNAGALRPALEALLRKDPAERADGDLAEKLLREAADGVLRPDPQPSPQPPMLSPNRSRRRPLVIVAVAIVVAAAVSGVLWFRAPHGSSVRTAPGLQVAPLSGFAPGLASSPAPPGSATATLTPRVTSPASAHPSGSPGHPPSSAASAGQRPPGAKAVLPAKSSGNSLSAVFNNVAVTDDTNTDAGDFDGGIASFSAQALAAGGVTPGKAVTAAGVAVTWPATAGTGRADNAIATGQTITMHGSGSKLAFLVSSDYGPITAGGTITYADGTTQAYTITSPDWFVTASDNTVVTSSYQNRGGNERFDQPCGAFGVSVPLTAGKTVASVRLPAAGVAPIHKGTPTLHIFAVGIG